MSYVVLSFDILLNRTVADLTEQGGIFKKAKKPSSRQIHNLVRNSLAKYANHYVNRGASELAQIQYTYYGHTLQWDQPIGSRDGFAAWPMAIMGGSAFHGQKVFKASKDSDFEDDEILHQIELACAHDEQDLEHWKVGSCMILDLDPAKVEGATKDVIIDLRGNRFGDLCALELPGNANIYPTIAPRDIDLTLSRYTGDNLQYTYTDFNFALLISEVESACRLSAAELKIDPYFGQPDIRANVLDPNPQSEEQIDANEINFASVLTTAISECENTFRRTEDYDQSFDAFDNVLNEALGVEYNVDFSDLDAFPNEMGWKEMSSEELAKLEAQFIKLPQFQKDKQGIMGPLHTYISDAIYEWGR